MYQPALRPDQIKALYYLKLKLARPMTELGQWRGECVLPFPSSRLIRIPPPHGVGNQNPSVALAWSSPVILDSLGVGFDVPDSQAQILFQPEAASGTHSNGRSRFEAANAACCIRAD